MPRLSQLLAVSLCLGAGVPSAGAWAAALSSPAPEPGLQAGGLQVGGVRAPATDTPAFEGRRLWLKYNCYSCHGMHAGGAIAINIQGLGAAVPFAVGGGEAGFGMPDFSRHLSATDIKNLSAYVNVAGTSTEPTFLRWWKADPKQ